MNGFYSNEPSTRTYQGSVLNAAKLNKGGEKTNKSYWIISRDGLRLGT